MKVIGLMIAGLMVVFGLLAVKDGLLLVIFGKQHTGVVGEKVDERLYRMHVETTYLVQTDEQSYRVKSGSTLPEGSSLTFWALDGSDEGSSSAFSYDMFFGLVMVIAGIGLPIKYYRVTHKKTTPRV